MAVWAGPAATQYLSGLTTAADTAVFAAGSTALARAVATSAMTIAATQGINSAIRGDNINRALGNIINEDSLKQVIASPFRSRINLYFQFKYKMT